LKPSGNNYLRIKKINQRVILKSNKDINGMEITYGIIKKKNQNLFEVNYNKSAKLCNPCMDACKKVNNKVNGRKLSTVSNNEMKEIINFFLLIDSFTKLCLLSISLSSLVGIFILEKLNDKL